MTVSGMDAEYAARELGTGGVDNIVTNAERICAYESERIALTNESVLAGLQVQFNLLRDEERHIEDRLRYAPPPGDLRRLRRKAIYCWFLVVLLTVAGLAFALLTFDPFRLGWKAWLYCSGIAALTPFLIDKLLDGPRMERVIKWLTAATAIAAVTGLMLLAVIRGNLLAQEIRSNAAPAVIIDDATPQAPPQNTFYDSTLTLLRVTLLLLAFAMELGAGLALHDAWRTAPDNSEDWKKLRAELVLVRQSMAAIARQAIMLKNEPATFAARFWRDFYRGLLTTAARSAMMKLLLFILTAAALAPGLARGQSTNRLNLVIAVDLTQSVTVKGPDGKSEFEKNLDGVTRILAQVPANTRVTVIGITDHSFTELYILLRARVPEDAGYFGERLTAARAQLVSTWHARRARLSSGFQHTDIFGALLLASDIFARDARSPRQVLILLSDMRESTSELDLESLDTIPPFPALAKNCGQLPIFRGVKTYVLGVDGAGRSMAYWESLRAFWRGYFQHAGAKLQSYSALRYILQSSDLVGASPKTHGP